MAQPSLHPLWNSLELDRSSARSLQDQITAFFRAAIRSGRMPRGRKLPSSRQLALEHDISRTTAVEAYEHLVAEGYLVSRRGAGIFIAEVLPEDLEYAHQNAINPRMHKDGYAPWLDMRNYLLPLAPGMPAIDHFPWATWARLTNQIFRERPLNAISYGDPQGEPALRETIAEYLAVARGITCSPRQIIIMSGSEHCMSLATRAVTTKGAVVWFEDPGYPFLHPMLLELGLRPVPIPVDAEGLDVAAGQTLAAQARLAVVFPSHQYPLGITMSLERRKALVAWAQANDAWILENEFDGDYRYTSRPLTPLYTLAEGRAMYCGSLSKALAPGLRISYLVVPEGLVDKLLQRTTLAPMLTQLVLARFSASGQMSSHMRKMRLLYGRRRALLVDALQHEAAGLLSLQNLPEAGLRVLATLPASVSDTQVSVDSLAAGIKVDPLSVCFRQAPQQPGLIIGFASTPEERIGPSVRLLADILRRTPPSHI
jgi:GntR family transcriptional regulator / MocR family aminotransferase